MMLLFLIEQDLLRDNQEIIEIKTKKIDKIEGDIEIMEETINIEGGNVNLKYLKLHQGLKGDKEEDKGEIEKDREYSTETGRSRGHSTEIEKDKIEEIEEIEKGKGGDNNKIPKDKEEKWDNKTRDKERGDQLGEIDTKIHNKKKQIK